MKSGFYLNLTFQDFNFPMPPGKCSLYETTELLIFAHVHQTVKMLCGKRSLFYLLWDSHFLRMAYMKKKGMLGTAHFLVHYQLCEEASMQPSTHVISNRTLYMTSGIFSVDFMEKHFLPLNDNWKKYSMHIIGDKFQVVSVAIGGPDVDNTKWNIEAYEGPHSADGNKFPYDPFLWKHMLLFSFVTFQCYVDIVCRASNCPDLVSHYILESDPQHSSQLVLYADKSFLFQYPSTMCNSPKSYMYESVPKKSSVVYCPFLITTSDPAYKIQVSLEDVTFAGPDYLSNTNEEHTCLLAGVTLLDAHRLLLYNDDIYKDSRMIPSRVVADSVLPEITTCYKTAMASEDGDETYELPLKKFPAITQNVFILLYAYGSFIDLGKSSVVLNVTTTTCIGLFVGCPVLYSDGFLEISEVGPFLSSGFMKGSKSTQCEYGSFLQVSILPRSKSHFVVVLSYCTLLNFANTKASINTHMGDDFTDECVLVQSNPYFRHSREISKCVFEDSDTVIDIQHHYSTSIVEFSSIMCSYLQQLGVLVDVMQLIHNTNNGSDYYEKTPLINGKIDGAMHSQVITYTAHCINFETKVRTRCSEVIYTSQLEVIPSAFQDPKREHQPICQKYTIDLSPDIRQIIRIPNAYIILQILVAALNSPELKLSEERVGRLEYAIGEVQLTLSLSLSGQCSMNRKTFQLQVTGLYHDSFHQQLTMIQWNVYMTDKERVELKMYQFPLLSGWEIHITSRTDPSYNWRSNTSKSINCTAALNVTNNEIVVPALRHDMVALNSPRRGPFVGYHFIWTQQEYTWLEVENICARLGMHLASMTSETEYQIVRNLLSGDGYKLNNTKDGHGLLTPCRLETVLCLVYIGLKYEVN